MCGIAGIFTFGNPSPRAPIGSALMTMSRCLQHRGADSAGIAIFAPRQGKDTIQVVLPSDTPLPEPQFIEKVAGGGLTGLREEPSGFSASLTALAGGAAARIALVSAIESNIPGSVVTSLGSSMSIYKTVGEVDGLTETVEPLRGTHGIAHLRLATESKIDPAHAQPFWGRPFPDVAVTHNGHITNYYKQRQKLEARGYTFASKNDSEIIGILIGEQMAEGSSLSEALCSVTKVLDGSYSFVVATANGLGVARDAFATKPLLFAETDAFVAIASEQQALHRLLGDTLTILEIEPKEHRTWEKA